MAGSAVPNGHSMDPDLSNLVQRVHMLTEENEEGRTHLIRIVGSSKGICPRLKPLPSHLPAL